MERPTSAPWLDSKHKEVVSYCTLLQEHSHQCYVKGKGQNYFAGSDEIGKSGMFHFM